MIAAIPQQILAEALKRVDYGDQYIELDWPCMDPAISSQGRSAATPRRIDLLAFLDVHRRDWQTSAIAAEFHSGFHFPNDRDGERIVRQLFDATAAPTVLLSNGSEAELWIECWDVPRRIPKVKLSVDGLSTLFDENRNDVDRRSLARLRGGQKFLFDRIYDARRDQLADFLHAGLDKASQRLRGLLKHDPLAAESCNVSLSHVAIAMLAARIFEDKGFFEHQSTPSQNARKLLMLAESNSNGFFRHVIKNDLAHMDAAIGASNVNELLLPVMAHLTGPVSFSMITPDTLGDLYERALVANGHRGGSVNPKGIHYTPLSLAKQILKRIPVEEFPPSQRYIADLSCGSGSFLLAATSRLHDAYDANEIDAEESVFDHLSAHVIGNDQDEIAILVARLRYLLTHWIEYRKPDKVPIPKFSRQDGLELTHADFGGIAPAAIVGNPPFHGSSGDQMANRFLRAAVELLAPGGYLGMIMPAGFLKMTRQKAPATRKQLLETCQLLEIWEMPEKAVGSNAEQATCLVIARKRRPNEQQDPEHPVLFKLTHSRKKVAIKQLIEKARSTWTFVANGFPGDGPRGWQSDASCRLIASPIDDLWHRSDLSRTLGQICQDASCLGIKARTSAKYSKQSAPGLQPYLQHQGRLNPYFLLRSDWHNDPRTRGPFVDPLSAEIAKKEFWPLYRGNKILISCRSNRNANAQVVAAFDAAGVFPEDDFRCISIPGNISALPEWAHALVSSHPKKSVLLWLTAIINSPIGHAWVGMSSTPQGLLKEIIHTIPLPHVFDPRVAELVSRLKAVVPKEFNKPTWSFWSDRPSRLPGNDYKTLAGQINALLVRAYGLTKRDFDTIGRYLQGMTDPWIDAKHDAHTVNHQERRITGTVISVDISLQQLCCMLPKYSDDASTPINISLPKDLPGWALRKGTEFTCLAPKEGVCAANLLTDPWLLRDFRPFPYMYLSANQIDQLATDSLQERRI